MGSNLKLEHEIITDSLTLWKSGVHPHLVQDHNTGYCFLTQRVVHYFHIFGKEIGGKLFHSSCREDCRGQPPPHYLITPKDSETPSLRGLRFPGRHCHPEAAQHPELHPDWTSMNYKICLKIYVSDASSGGLSPFLISCVCPFHLHMVCLGFPVVIPIFKVQQFKFHKIRYISSQFLFHICPYPRFAERNPPGLTGVFTFSSSIQPHVLGKRLATCCSRMITI